MSHSPALTNEQDWISLMDYATEYGVSLSTLRRHIKTGKIPFKVEHGRYLLKSPYASGVVKSAPVASAAAAGAAATNANELRELKHRLQLAQEEISELKMLVALYEEQLAPIRPGQPQRVNGY